MSIPFCVPSEDPGLRRLPAGLFGVLLRRLVVTLAVIQLANCEGYEKSPGEDELLVHLFSYCIILLFQPFLPLPPHDPLPFIQEGSVKRALQSRGLERREGNGHTLVSACFGQD